ncbi:MAG TPA: hypothetical protein VNO81_07875, partial [Candidatus Nitrosotenuis sp.]|nr:hypothetical protein [Candidatus Nitrosotenuis sp.]
WMLAAALALAPLAARASQELALGQDGFRILMPQSPVYSTGGYPTPVGEIIRHSYQSKNGPRDFAVVHATLPAAAIILGPDNIFEAVRKGVLEHNKAEQIECKRIRVGGYPGRDMTFRVPASGDQPEMAGRAWLLLVGRRFYILHALVPQGPEAARELEQFFASLQITPRSGRTAAGGR